MFNPSQPCEVGYEPLGTNFQMVCMNGGWEGSDGTQLPIQCVDINECLQIVCGHGGQTNISFSFREVVGCSFSFSWAMAGGSAAGASWPNLL